MSTTTCPICGAIAEYNSYYGRITCTSCSWESEQIGSPTDENPNDKLLKEVLKKILRQVDCFQFALINPCTEIRNAIKKVFLKDYNIKIEE